VLLALLPLPARCYYGCCLFCCVTFTLIHRLLFVDYVAFVRLRLLPLRCDFIDYVTVVARCCVCYVSLLIVVVYCSLRLRRCWLFALLLLLRCCSVVICSVVYTLLLLFFWWALMLLFVCSLRSVVVVDCCVRYVTALTFVER